MGVWRWRRRQRRRLFIGFYTLAMGGPGYKMKPEFPDPFFFFFFFNARAFIVKPTHLLGHAHTPAPGRGGKKKEEREKRKWNSA